LSSGRLLLGTNNKAKVREYRVLLEGIPCEIITPAELGITQPVEESGETLEQNAVLKAKAYALMSNLTALADDSGLEVDALGGEPGVLSARYAGEGVSDRERIEYLLAKITAVPWEQRGARFRCIIAVASPDGEVTLCQGECPGIITFEPKGAGGFGYDPVFYLPELDKTMAELSMEQKNRLSHRGRAAMEARNILINKEL
jgi:XTP/dITP diphosphohydrolase